MMRSGSKAIFVLSLCTITTPVLAEGLPDCPKSPNCVSSEASNPDRQVAALKAGDSAAEARQRLTAVLADLPRVNWTAISDSRVEAEFTTRILRFTDDVIFEIGEDGLIQVRSASRVGYSDLGANRTRVEMLRERLANPAQ